MLIETPFTAGERKEFYDPGDFFRLLAATDPVTVTFYKDGAEVAEAEGVGEGYAEKFRVGQFDRFAIVSATAQTLQFVARLGNDVAYDTPPTGDVNITNMSGAFTQAQKTVTNASGQLLAAKAARRYLLIQNNDASGDVYINLTGVACTTANGIKIAAGGSYECQGFAPTAAVTAIGSIASNANVVAVEG
jgi:hypothetical protein